MCERPPEIGAKVCLRGQQKTRRGAACGEPVPHARRGASWGRRRVEGCSQRPHRLRGTREGAVLRQQAHLACRPGPARANLGRRGRNPGRADGVEDRKRGWYTFVYPGKPQQDAHGGSLRQPPAPTPSFPPSGGAVGKGVGGPGAYSPMEGPAQHLWGGRGRRPGPAPRFPPRDGGGRRGGDGNGLCLDRGGAHRRLGRRALGSGPRCTEAMGCGRWRPGGRRRRRRRAPVAFCRAPGGGVHADRQRVRRPGGRMAGVVGHGGWRFGALRGRAGLLARVMRGRFWPQTAPRCARIGPPTQRRRPPPRCGRRPGARGARGAWRHGARAPCLGLRPLSARH